MLYRRFGRTRLEMPVFSCGGMRYQHKWQDLPLNEIPPENQANLEATIRTAVDAGINHIETARGYGSSERQLGLILPQFPRDQLIVQTKIVPRSDARQFVTDFRDSLARLQLEYVDLLALHGINNHRQLWHSIRPNGCLAAARALQQEGLVRHVGFSTHGDTEVILDALRWEGAGGFDYVNLHYYYIFQRHAAALQTAAERDQGVFIISPADKGGMLYRPPAKLVELCQPLHPLVFNCLWCLRHPEIQTLSLGAARPGDFALQLSALDHWSDAEELVPPVADRLHATLVETVGRELAEHYHTGLTATEERPGYLAIDTILWLRNLALAWDLLEYAKMRYQLLGNAGSWFFGRNAGDVELFAESLASAAKDHPLGAKLPEILAETHTLLWEAPKQRLSAG